MFVGHKYSGWWYTYPSEKYAKVSWDDENATIWKKMFQTTNQYINNQQIFGRVSKSGIN